MTEQRLTREAAQWVAKRAGISVEDAASRTVPPFYAVRYHWLATEHPEHVLSSSLPSMPWDAYERTKRRIEFLMVSG